MELDEKNESGKNLRHSKPMAESIRQKATHAKNRLTSTKFMFYNMRLSGKSQSTNENQLARRLFICTEDINLSLWVFWHLVPQRLQRVYWSLQFAVQYLQFTIAFRMYHLLQRKKDELNLYSISKLFFYLFIYLMRKSKWHKAFSWHLSNRRCCLWPNCQTIVKCVGRNMCQKTFFFSRKCTFGIFFSRELTRVLCAHCDVGR